MCPLVGRFLSVDPLTKSYPWYTPYQFAGNSPIKNLDLDGAEEIPNEIWNAAKNYGKNLIRQAAMEVVNKAITSITKKTEEKLDKMVNSQNSKKGMAGVAGEFILGVGPETRSFGPNHPLTKSLAESHLAESAQEKFIELNKKVFAYGEYSKVQSFEGLITFGATGLFDNSGILMENIDNAAQMVGSATFTVSLSADRKTLNFKVGDTKSRYSFFYHGKLPGTEELAKSKSRDQASFMGTTDQTYEWSKDFDASKYLKGVVIKNDKK